MIKRSFFTLSQPKLTYDLLDPQISPPETIPVQDSLTLLLADTIDSTKQALIQKGDAVKKGEKLKLYEDSSAYVLSSAAGTIKRYGSYSDDFGNTATYILIKPDTGDTQEALGFTPEPTLEFADQHLRHLPGAPPFEMMLAMKDDLKAFVITGADPDILSTTSQYITTQFADELKEGIKILKEMTKVSKFFITLPRDLATQADFGAIEILRTPKTYPSALPAMVMKSHLNTVLPAGSTPEDLGIVFIRPEAVVSLARAFEANAPVFDKTLTIIDKHGRNHRLTATMGTPLSKIFSRFDIHINEEDRVIIGGPMKGHATFTLHHPVTSDMNMVIVQDNSVIEELSNTPCVNCGECIRICPANVPVNLLVRYLEADLYEEAADKFDLESCIECGLCAFVCKARIPLYQYIRLGKHELLTLRAQA